MRRLRLTFRRLPNAGQISFATSEAVPRRNFPPLQRCLVALVRPFNTSSKKPERNANLKSRHDISVALVLENAPRLRNDLDDVDPATLSTYHDASTHLIQAMERGDSSEDIWDVFEMLQRDECWEFLSRNDAQTFRDKVLTAALADNSRLNVLVDTAHHLLTKKNFYWPNIYMKIMHHMLEKGQHDDSIRWHLRLAPKFSPSTDIFGAILSSFIVDPSPKMQSNLTALYVSSTSKQLYDYIIPVLFAAGHSKLARLWRKKLLVFRDLPKSNRSKPFLQFLVQYYPSISLTEEERAIAGVETSLLEQVSSQSSHNDHSNKGQYSDSIIANWFASSWTSIEFAINFAHRLGLRVIGPRSLQSLALREAGAKMVNLRLARIEKLGIAVSNQNYCKILVFFAKHEEDLLLADLLACDIHPDEFDDVETRQMLMASSVRSRDWRRERLLQGVEWAIESGTSSRRLNALLHLELTTYKLGRARQVLDRMEALKVNMNQQSASKLLQTTFRGIGKHPTKGKRRVGKLKIESQSLLNGAIDIIRRVALHEVAIPLRYWKLLLYNLGRSGRLGELQQLSEEIVQLYTPPLGGLVPICPGDLPHSLLKGRSESDISMDISKSTVFSNDTKKELQRYMNPASSPSLSNLDTSKMDSSNHRWSKTDSSSTAYSSPELVALTSCSKDTMKTRIEACGNEDCLMSCIPADLPFSHRQHPVQQIFDASLQRSIVRWGFDQKLGLSPACSSLVAHAEDRITDFDIASGVRLLARLRDLGVLIDLQVLRAAILSKIALGQVPGRPRDRSRDRHELSPEYMKILFDEAWGSDIFHSALEMRRQLEKQKPKLWDRYSKLFGQSFDMR
ncbi:hypothetical protein C2857_002058 [Epichloe festucae Fl1]|uniref:Pentatricopeptide repeat domain-containing protein n=1 Tax=Epichloe festucae (strain Fl1) TaxID=877507 RepID=A0A7U3Q1K3_EPIFF|nr:hypothetical protein C2857_002058 [Epichloe festucae Fl1]